MNLAPLAAEVGDRRAELVIVGSGALALRGVLPASQVHDLDLILTTELYESLKARGWREVADAWWRYCAACDRGFVGSPPLCECGAEARPVETEPEPPWLEWDCDGLLVSAAAAVPERDAGWRRLRAEDGHPFESAFGSAEMVAGWPCGSLALMRSWYVHAGRPKDIAKVAAIDEFVTVEHRMLLAAAEANARIASCHEEVACPKCHAPAGTKCVRALRQFAARGIFATGQPTLKHPHRERWTQVQPAR